MSELPQKRLYAVSYTHLDVYKRQVPPYFSKVNPCPLASINATANNEANRLFLLISIQNSNLAESYAPLIRIDLHRPSTLLNRNKRSFSASQSLFGYYQFVNLLYQIKTICQDIFKEANIRIRL